MAKRVEFHQAQIAVVAKVVDDERSYGTPQFTLNVLLDTDAEWAAARKQIAEGLRQLEEKANAEKAE